jgi:hypothetical protein
MLTLMQIVSNFLVGIGTLVLAVIAWWGLRQASNQQHILSKQLDIQQTQLRPNIQVKSFNFKKNALSVEIENVSTVAAYRVGVSTRFYLVYPLFFDSPESNQPLSRSRVEQMIAKKKQLYAKYQLVHPKKGPKLIYEGNIVIPDEAVTFAGNDLPGAIILSRETRNITVEPRFNVSTGLITGLTGKAFDFAELTRFLLQHDVQWVAVSFALIFKDVTEEIIGSEWITKFAFDIKGRTSLANAHTHGSPIYFLPLSAAEIQTKKMYLPGQSYRSRKTSK